MTLTRIIAGLLLLAAVSFGLIACGDDDDAAGDQTPAATTAAADGGDETSAATSPGAGNDNTPAAGGGNSVDVKTEDFAFHPDEITVPAGEPITFNFTNADSSPHTFTLYVDEEFTQAIDGGSATESAPQITVAFVAPGEYYFRCKVHPSQMQGELTAQ
jgi:plastocyanin